MAQQILETVRSQPRAASAPASSGSRSILIERRPEYRRNGRTCSGLRASFDVSTRDRPLPPGDHLRRNIARLFSTGEIDPDARVGGSQPSGAGQPSRSRNPERASTAARPPCRIRRAGRDRRQLRISRMTSQSTAERQTASRSPATTPSCPDGRSLLRRVSPAADHGLAMVRLFTSRILSFVFQRHVNARDHARLVALKNDRVRNGPTSIPFARPVSSMFRQTAL